jgi:7,8-dihydropterin-6-yl-methyl-4-(beta-D-ribofuranosyl)aminobenzene 5'-phosphate synthase
MDRRFAEEGIDRFLHEGKIGALVTSHEHFDHFWGIGSTLRRCPDITLYIPADLRPQGLDFIKRQGHTGQVIRLRPDQPVLLLPGLAVVNFPVRTLLQVDSENVLYARIRNRGMAMMTGCGHGEVLNLLDYAGRTFQGGDRFHALYGGLHISPLEDWDESGDRIVEALGRYGIAKLACNHCTGRRAVEKMLQAGLPVIPGTTRHGSQNEPFVGNGDAVELS